MVGIIGAMEVEVAKLKEMLTDTETLEKAGMTFLSGKLNGKDVVVVRSGIGKVNAGICTQILVDAYNVDYIINTGVAGSLNNDINIGDIVLSSDTLQHDMDATGFGYEIGVIPQMKQSVFEADKRLIDIAKKCFEDKITDVNVFVGRIVSGDQFISDKDKKNWLVENFKGYCTEMEGAAIAQAAYLNGVPFIVIRAISDKADDSATEDYPTFEAKAAAHCVKLLEEMIKEI
ncbi:MAG: 5'-methylthioadenosine/adenosylhomocysteine nucleosidase [Lachnospiraceae bacterium]|nr:5'-methylthioadenosine/adenosylhomocysteine nucleosidase [Lachnospiraceae bacterium]MDE6698341.1 5'-methylthioadenosine/adenosylhomocysteine nucleosidase [Lachnospiraceae bacterium]